MTLFFKVSHLIQKNRSQLLDPDEYIDDVWENDIPLDYLVTPTEVLSFLAA